MASTLHTHTLPHLPGYDSAAKLWKRRADLYPRAAAVSDELPLGKPSQRALKIVKQGDDYSVKYHDTRVITYHADGTLTLRVWNSRNTELLVNDVLDKTLMVSYDGPRLGSAADLWTCTPEGRETRVYRRCADTEGQVQVHACGSTTIRLHTVNDRWALLNTVACMETIVIPTINRKGSREQYRAYRLDEFTLFCKAYKALGNPVATGSTTSGILTHAPQRLEALRNQAKWPELARCYGAEQMRLDILRMHPECFDTTRTMCLDATQYDTALAAHRRYPWVG